MSIEREKLSILRYSNFRFRCDVYRTTGHSIPVGTRRNDNTLTTPKRRRRRSLDAMKTPSLRYYCIMCSHGSIIKLFQNLYGCNMIMGDGKIRSHVHKPIYLKITEPLIWKYMYLNYSTTSMPVSNMCQIRTGAGHRSNSGPTLANHKRWIERMKKNHTLITRGTCHQLCCPSQSCNSCKLSTQWSRSKSHNNRLVTPSHL